MSRRDWVQGLMDAPALERLATGLAGSELQSVLLQVMHSRAGQREPKDVLAQYQRDVFCAPAPVDLRTSMRVDEQLLAAAEAFEAIELSPVAPLGTCSVVALTDQNRVLSALRMTESVSDPTNVLALECALRLRSRPQLPVHLATSQRVIRTQPVPKRPGHTQHFRIFVLASGGLEAKDRAFTVQSLVLHIRTMLAALERLERVGYAFGARHVAILTTAEQREMGDRVAEGVGASTTRGPLEHAYYSGGLRYQIWVTAPDGTSLPLVDGGVFDWLAKLASNRRARYIATGAGAQLIALQFQASRAPAGAG